MTQFTINWYILFFLLFFQIKIICNYGNKYKVVFCLLYSIGTTHKNVYFYNSFLHAQVLMIIRLLNYTLFIHKYTYTIAVLMWSKYHLMCSTIYKNQWDSLFKNQIILEIYNLFWTVKMWWNRQINRIKILICDYTNH